MHSSMNPSDRAAEIFDQALQLAESARELYLHDACGADTTLRRLIDDMLAAHAIQGDFLAKPTGERPARATDPAVPADTADPDSSNLRSARLATKGTQIGRYKLLQLIGEGGFGEVWMAEQREPIKRRVALKIIKLGMDSKQVIARFEAERQALAMMDHPNIARVFDAGVTDAGRPYFVMELIRGDPITQYCDNENIEPRDRLELFARVCLAVQHAHQKGIIHRDLKPSNVLVTLQDGAPVPKVIDFGIAKSTSGSLTDKTLFTEFRQLIGTPQYMSPEQAEMSGVDIDTRSDIYSLGVLLYELLTGVTPFDIARLRSAALEEMRRIIREEDPPRPSTRVSTLGESLSIVARHRRVEPRRLATLIRGELDWIIMKALDKQPGRRYGTASALEEDIGRHLRGEPVVAAPPSRIYALTKTVRRHRTAASFFVTILSVLAAGGTTAFALWQRAEESLDQVETQMRNSIRLVGAVSGLLSEFDPRDIPVRRELQFALAEIEELTAQIARDFIGYPASESEIRVAHGRLYNSIGRREEAQKQMDLALAAGRIAFGDQDTRYADLLMQYAWSIADRSRAPDLGLEALAIYRRDLGDRDARTVRCVFHLAVSFHEAGRTQESEFYRQDALARMRPDDPDLPNYLKAIAENEGSLGHLEEARSLYVEAVHLARQSDDQHNLDHILHSYGCLLRDMGELNEAEERLREALAIRAKLVESDSPYHYYFYVTELSLGSTLRLQGHFGEAEVLLLDAHEGYDPPEDPVLDAIRVGILGEIVKLYDQWSVTAPSKAADADAWRSKLLELSPSP